VTLRPGSSSSSRTRCAGAAGATLLRALGETYLDLFQEAGEPALLDEAFGCLELAAFEDAIASG
jgi:hypothetical protein